MNNPLGTGMIFKCNSHRKLRREVMGRAPTVYGRQAREWLRSDETTRFVNLENGFHQP